MSGTCSNCQHPKSDHDLTGCHHESPPRRGTYGAFRRCGCFQFRSAGE